MRQRKNSKRHSSKSSSASVPLDYDFFASLDAAAEEQARTTRVMREQGARVEAHRQACEIDYLKSVYRNQGEYAFYSLLKLIKAKRKNAGFDYLMNAFFTDPTKRLAAYQKINQLESFKNFR